MHCRGLRSRWVILLLLTVTVAIVTLTNLGVRQTKVRQTQTPSIIRLQGDEDLPISSVQAERWIVVDGTNIPNEQLLHTDDVSGWKLLVFGKYSTIFRDKRCSNCLFINGNSPLSNTKMMAFIYAISHGAKWIYVTNQVINLKDQVQGFHTEARIKGLLYTGQLTFDAERHFGVKDISVRTNQLSYQLGDYVIPSVQSRWRPPEHGTGTVQFDINAACRLPHVMVPPHVFPATDLIGSLVGYRSFWALGSLLSGARSPLAYWWLRLMEDVDKTIGQYPPSCPTLTSTSTVNEGIRVSQAIAKTLSKWKCEPKINFFMCGNLLAKELAINNFITQDEVSLIKNWFEMLIIQNFKEPERIKSKYTISDGDFHNVVLESTSKINSDHKKVGNPFKSICKSPMPGLNVAFVPPMQDILLIVIFNHPVYANILYLDYLYRKFFTNIIYCGRSLKEFREFQRKYPRPVSFIELSEKELHRGVYGNLCSAYAIDIGYRVSGYMQMSDDVLLNMWNIVSLPRDRIWFQSSIRQGKLTTARVANVETRTRVQGKYWHPWEDKRWGIGHFNEALTDFKALMKTPDQTRIVSFLKQLNESFGNNAGPGAFYEASDIFYVPQKYKEDFSFFSKQFVNHSLFLEIAIPTTLCGLDNIDNIVRLNGSYLWYHERDNYMDFFNPEHIFLHPWKLNDLIKKADSQTFFCTKYLPHIGRNKTQ